MSVAYIKILLSWREESHVYFINAIHIIYILFTCSWTNVNDWGTTAVSTRDKDFDWNIVLSRETEYNLRYSIVLRWLQNGHTCIPLKVEGTVPLSVIILVSAPSPETNFHNNDRTEN